MNRYQAHPIRERKPRLREGLFIIRDAVVFGLAVVVIVLIAGLNGPNGPRP